MFEFRAISGVHAFTCEHLLQWLFWPSQGPSCLIFNLSHIAAIPSWNQIHGYSIGIIVLCQGRTNDSAIIIAQIPCFCFNHTKLVFNIFINIFVNNLRAIICPTTNHNCCSTICYWSMKRLASFEISMKWPLIVFIFGNDWKRWGSIVTSNEKGCMIGRCNRVTIITP